MKKHLVRRIGAVGTIVMAISGVLIAQPAQAASGPRPHFQLPFACNEQWRLGTYIGHDDYEIDMTKVGAPSLGSPILASYSGTVMASGYSGGAGNRVRIWHGGGWQSEYYHMRDTPLVNVGQSVQQGQILGFVGTTGDSSGPHLHYAQRANGTSTSNGTVVHAYFNGVPSGITHDNSNYGYNDTSANCHGGLYREPSGVIAVLVGGAPIRFQDWSEYSAAGYASSHFVNVPSGWFNSLPQAPRTSAYPVYPRNNSTGAIYAIAGGAKYQLSGAEWGQIPNAQYVNSPVSWLNTLPSRPAVGTLVGRFAGAEIYEVTHNGVRHLSAAEWNNRPYTKIPDGWIDAIACSGTSGPIC